MLVLALIGSSRKFRAVLENVQIVASVSYAALLRGERAIGKEIIA
jgi:transcriptional regulator with GAF, ATPase, and Fis domain